MNIILFGFQNCGKTTIGKLLAKKLAMRFIDIDCIIETLYEQKYGKKLSVREIYKVLGAESFRSLEQEAILLLTDIDNVVIATGGGSVLNPDNVAARKQIGTLVYLQTAKETIKDRMFSGELPAFLAGKDSEEEFEKMYNERKAIYENVADVFINADGEMKQVVEKIIKEIEHG